MEIMAIEIVDFPIKNGDLPMKNGGFSHLLDAFIFGAYLPNSKNFAKVTNS